MKFGISLLRKARYVQDTMHDLQERRLYHFSLRESGYFHIGSHPGLGVLKADSGNHRAQWIFCPLSHGAFVYLYI